MEPSGSGSEEGSTLRQPRSIAQWREAKESAAVDTLNRFQDSTELVERALNHILDIYESLGALNPNDDRTILSFMLLATHRILLNSFDLLIERQSLESMAILRSAIEMAADAEKVHRKPQLARTWLKRGEDQGAFDKGVSVEGSDKGIRAVLR